MKELAAGKLVERRSRFYAHLYMIDSAEEIQKIVKNHKRLYKKANHLLKLNILPISYGRANQNVFLSCISIKKYVEGCKKGHEKRCILINAQIS